MLHIQAFQIGEALSISKLKSILSYEFIYQDRDELMLKIADFKYIYCFNYGVICDCNISEEERHDFLISIGDVIINPQEPLHTEEFQIDIKDHELNAMFDRVIIPKFDIEMIRLVMLNTAQSVALNAYSFFSDGLLEETNVLTASLEKKGRLRISGKKLKKFLGKALHIRNKISKNLYVFEAPEVTWTQEDYHILNSKLRETFELRERHRAISDQIGIIKENLDLFKEILHQKESSKLEWIIIILILIEVIDLFVLKLT